MATAQELDQARTELRSAYLLFQAETFAFFSYFRPEEIITGKDKSDLELAILKEAVSIWKTGTYNANNILSLLNPDSPNRDIERQLLTKILGFKKNKGEWGVFNDLTWNQYKTTNRGRLLLNDIDNRVEELKKEKTAAETAQATAEAERDQYKKEKEEAETAKKKAEQERDNSNGEINKLITYWNENLKDKLEKPLSIEGLEKVKTELDKIPALEANQKPDDYETIKGKLSDWQTNFPNLEPIQVKEQLTAQGNQAGQSAQYLNKLLAIYKEKITSETKTFYLNNLGLDESKDINPIYYNSEYFNLTKEERENTDEKKSYLEKLSELSGESEPQEIINAFKIVALISMTQQAQDESDEWVDPATQTIKPEYNKPRYKKLKQNKINYFNKVKSFWDLNQNLKTTEKNNPLYLPVVEEQEEYKKKINIILTIWQ